VSRNNKSAWSAAEGLPSRVVVLFRGPLWRSVDRTGPAVECRTLVFDGLPAEPDDRGHPRPQLDGAERGGVEGLGALGPGQVEQAAD